MVLFRVARPCGARAAQGVGAATRVRGSVSGRLSPEAAEAAVRGRRSGSGQRCAVRSRAECRRVPARQHLGRRLFAGPSSFPCPSCHAVSSLPDFNAMATSYVTILTVFLKIFQSPARGHLDRRLWGSTKNRCARLTGERQGVRVPRNEGVTNHVSPRAVRRSSRGVRRSVGSGSCGRAVEHRKGTCPGCRGFRIGRRQHRWPRYGERSASPAVSENPCTHESLSSGPGRPPPHLALSAGVAKGRQNCRSRRRTGRRSQTRS